MFYIGQKIVAICDNFDLKKFHTYIIKDIRICKCKTDNVWLDIGFETEEEVECTACGHELDSRGSVDWYDGVDFLPANHDKLIQMVLTEKVEKTICLN